MKLAINVSFVFLLGSFWLGATASHFAGNAVRAEEPGTAAVREWPFDDREAKRRQREIAERLDLPIVLDKSLGKGRKLTFVLVPPGHFLKGDTFADEIEVQTEIKEPFYISKYEITQDQWQAVMGTNPSETKGATLPVHNVSWNDCREFIRRLNGEHASAESERFALPTGAQWEYACRAGASTLWCFGDGLDAFERMDRNLPYQMNKYGWSAENAAEKLHPIGRLRPNAFGLHDMHGNVWEWCDEKKKGRRATLYGFRGGSWSDSPEVCRSAMRGFNFPESATSLIGFRIVRTPSPNDKVAIKPKNAVRSWTDKTGEYTTQAEFLDLKQGQVRLRKSNGEVITVPLESLSDADVQFVKSQVPEE